MTRPKKPLRPPPTDEVHIGHTRWTALAPISWPQIEFTYLTAEERARAGRFVHADARSRFVAGRATLRCILSRYLARAPETIEVKIDRGGKPRLKQLRGDPFVEFSISHSGPLVVVGVTGSEAIGVDIETVHQIVDIDTIADQFFTQAERDLLMATATESRSQHFLRIWTRKEAIFKAAGLGLQGFLASRDVNWILPTIHLPCDCDSRMWRVFTLHHPAIDGFIGACASSSQINTIEWFDVLPWLSEPSAI